MVERIGSNGEEQCKFRVLGGIAIATYQITTGLYDLTKVPTEFEKWAKKHGRDFFCICVRCWNTSWVKGRKEEKNTNGAEEIIQPKYQVPLGKWELSKCELEWIGLKFLCSGLNTRNSKIQVIEDIWMPTKILVLRHFSMWPWIILTRWSRTYQIYAIPSAHFWTLKH